MALVAYGSSSDECSEDEDVDNPSPELRQIQKSGTHKLKLPIPKQSESLESDEDEIVEQEHIKLILPPPSIISSGGVVEEDDEFLKKKAIPTLQPPKPVIRKGPVQITIPSLSSFKDDEKDENNRVKDNSIVNTSTNKGSGLLGLLPKPKSEFAPKIALEGTKPSTSMVPHSVMNKKKAVQANKSSSSVCLKTAHKDNTVKKLIEQYSESDESDTEEGTDFFSFNKTEKLPEVSAKEIEAMVAKQTARMEEAKFEQTLASENEEYSESSNEDTTTNYASQLDEEAIQALVGGSKSKRPKLSDVQVINLTANDIIQRDDWEKAHLQQETQYIPRGKLTETGTGKQKKKHQITYLAQQAKANELELQAMWAQNRQSRRQTQNKYGF